MTILVFAPKYSAPGDGVKNVFAPETLRYSKLFKTEKPFEIDAIKMKGVKPVEKASGYAKRRKQVLDQIAKYPANSVSSIAFFCHGWVTGMQFGFDLGSVKTLAQMPQLTGSCNIILYSCSCGNGKGTEGDGGLADALRDELCKAGKTWCTTFAHTVDGHATNNPMVRVFEGKGSLSGGIGGTWVVAPSSPLWKKWCKALKTTDLRLRYPSMTVAAVHAELEKMK